MHWMQGSVQFLKDGGRFRYRAHQIPRGASLGPDSSDVEFHVLSNGTKMI